MANRNRWFTYSKWWFSLARLNNQMVDLPENLPEGNFGHCSQDQIHIFYHILPWNGLVIFIRIIYLPNEDKQVPIPRIMSSWFYFPQDPHKMVGYKSAQLCGLYIPLWVDCSQQNSFIREKNGLTGSNGTSVCGWTSEGLFVCVLLCKC
jgi:hypothetical protein